MPPASSHDLFPSELKEGAIRRSVGGPRLSAWTLDFVQSLHITILEQFVDDAQDVLYRCGYEWGLQDMMRLNEHLRARLGPTLNFWQMDPKFIFESWWASLSEMGWGGAAFDFSLRGRGVIVIDLAESAVVAALGESDQPICHLYAGLLAGATSFFDRTERHGVEIQCASLGAPRCQFIVGPGSEIDSAERWRQQGGVPADIVGRLR